MGYSPEGRKESDTTEVTSTHACLILTIKILHSSLLKENELCDICIRDKEITNSLSFVNKYLLKEILPSILKELKTITL